jgi:hypothetical protein
MEPVGLLPCSQNRHWTSLHTQFKIHYSSILTSMNGTIKKYPYSTFTDQSFVLFSRFFHVCDAPRPYHSLDLITQVLLRQQ